MNAIGAAFLTTIVVASARGPIRHVDTMAATLLQRIHWVSGPVTGGLGTEARVDVPAGCQFTGEDGVGTFMEMTENPAAGNEEGVILCRDSVTNGRPWFILFRFDASGYVKDDEGNKLDAETILAVLRTATNADNEQRAKRGWAPVTLVGWTRPPFYDKATHNLTWALLATAGDGRKTVNYSVRMLGRNGVMHADLVLDSAQLASKVPAFTAILSTYRFETGHTYAEWKPGDKVAAFGLTALIAGGVGAAAVKMGLLTKTWKAIVALLVAAWKAIAAAAAALAAWLRSLFKRKPKAQAAGSTKASSGS